MDGVLISLEFSETVSCLIGLCALLGEDLLQDSSGSAYRGVVLLLSIPCAEIVQSAIRTI